MSLERVPCVAGLFSEKNGVALMHGSKCKSCNTAYFPKKSSCHNPDCTNSDMQDFDFGGQGKLWSYSVADYPPPPPHIFDKPFVSYAMGVVDLDCGVRLIGQMVDKPAEVKVDSRVELVIDALYHQDGKEFTTWKFKQIG